METIAVVTRDCAGVNAALRSVVRTATSHKMKVQGVIKGYDGLIDGRFLPLSRQSVSGILYQGGTILKTARSKRFLTCEGQNSAVKTIQDHAIDGVIVIGGNGSLTGAHVLATITDVPVIGIPATIDNDITGVDHTIGSDTAVNVALDALDKIRDTATSLERIFVLEVMGRDCGYIALQVALAGGCEEVLIPEMPMNLNTTCEEILKSYEIGKESWIVIVVEGQAKAHDVAQVITEKTGLETRVAVLGHIQRGGRPTAKDRILASRLGNHAVEVLRKGLTDHCVTIHNDELCTIRLEEAIQRKTIDPTAFYALIKLLT